MLRHTLALLDRAAPSIAAAFAERLFFTAPRARRSSGERLLREADPMRLSVDGRPVAAWRWGEGPAVALLHGWGGQAAQMTSFVPPLLERGFSAVALDAPGHGRSRRGLSSAPQFARALRAVADAVGGLHAVVAHSLGAAATALALRDGLRAGRVVFLGAAADPPRWAGDFAERLGVRPRLVEAMRLRSERRLGMRWRELHLPTMAARFEIPLLLIHDRDDADVPFADSEAIASAWPGAALLETSGVGHNRMLRDAAVVGSAVDFLSDGPVRGCDCGRPAPRRCDTCRLERELFAPDLRWA
jgi:pimeloyl-ACP methyl ester carboxylesterase